MPTHNKLLQAMKTKTSTSGLRSFQEEYEAIKLSLQAQQLSLTATIDNLLNFLQGQNHYQDSTISKQAQALREQQTSGVKLNAEQKEMLDFVDAKISQLTIVQSLSQLQQSEIIKQTKPEELFTIAQRVHHKARDSEHLSYLLAQELSSLYTEAFIDKPASFNLSEAGLSSYVHNAVLLYSQTVEFAPRQVISQILSSANLAGKETLMKLVLGLYESFKDTYPPELALYQAIKHHINAGEDTAAFETASKYLDGKYEKHGEPLALRAQTQLARTIMQIHRDMSNAFELIKDLTAQLPERPPGITPEYIMRVFEHNLRRADQIPALYNALKDHLPDSLEHIRSIAETARFQGNALKQVASDLESHHLDQPRTLSQH